MTRLVLLLLGLTTALVLAQHHHHDPFAGSNCTCDTFCDSSCSIFPEPTHNLTLYRMTPFGVIDMTNKNTGDAHGDTSFVLSRKTTAYECRENPSNFMCNGLAQFTGDNPNSTDLILSLTIEVDGNWGPYLYCNPVNSSNEVNGPWYCDSSLSGGGGHVPPNIPAQCKANFSVFGGYCFEGLFPKKVKGDVGDCCAAAQEQGITRWTYANGTCSLFKLAGYPRPCSGGVSGYYSGGGGGSSTCNCTRVYNTVGRENLTTSGMSGSSHPAGGEWYSHPIEGECLNGHTVGDGSGCTWRVAERNRVINATCMYKRLDANVESYDPPCFKQCAQPNNVTSTCYLRCYSEATQQMSHDELAAPWLKAFQTEGAGGCPEVTVVE